MTIWTDVAAETEIPEGQWKVIDIEGLSILLIHQGKRFYAIENTCSHDGGTLSDGELEADEIVCPRHGARFCIKTGEVTAPPAYEDIEAFPVRVEAGRVFVGVE